MTAKAKALKRACAPGVRHKKSEDVPCETFHMRTPSLQLHCEFFRSVSVVGALSSCRLNLTGPPHARLLRVPLSVALMFREGCLTMRWFAGINSKDGFEHRVLARAGADHVSGISDMWHIVTSCCTR